MKFEKNDIWCVIPVYNNGETLNKIVDGCRSYLNNILVVDDGSTDIDVKRNMAGKGVEVIRHSKNLGKGRALKTAIEYLSSKKAVYMITVDADGQHYPEDLPQILSAIKSDDCTLAIGYRNFETENIPNKSRFGRKFSNLWVRLETGINLKDTQSGYRAYPVKYISKLSFLSNSYNFEIEVLVRAVWAGLKIKEVPVKVFYPHSTERVSHFKPFLDNLRISLIHTHLVALRLLPLPPKKLVKKSGAEIDCKILLHPIRLFKKLLVEHSGPGELAVSAAVGTLLAVLPLIGLHSAAILYAAVRFRLNKVMALNIQHFFMPPFVPLICIEFGHLILHGRWLTDISFKTVCVQLPERILEWLVGSLVLAPAFAVLTGFIIYIICKIIVKIKKNPA